MLKSDPLKYRDLKDLELVTRKTQLPKKKKSLPGCISSTKAT